MLKATFQKHSLHFIIPGGTSRGVLTSKDSWYLIVCDDGNPHTTGIGECSIISGLSIDDRPDFEEKLGDVCRDINNYTSWLEQGLDDFPAIRFGLEMSLIDLETNGKRELFPSDFTSGHAGIPINGLVWMGSFDFMRQQIVEKIDAGYRCIKLKIGAIDFADELKLLKMIRKEFNADELELRVDANGAFSAKEALEKLKKLSDFTIHSIEQPIKQGQWEEMAKLCRVSPIDIALDEELIRVTREIDKKNLLETIDPQYIILKPSLLGGFSESTSYIQIAEINNIGWWVTSALEGNIGLNAIAQWTSTLNNQMPQGLGTGKLFANNISSPLEIDQAKLYYRQDKGWNLHPILDYV